MVLLVKKKWLDTKCLMILEKNLNSQSYNLTLTLATITSRSESSHSSTTNSSLGSAASPSTVSLPRLSMWYAKAYIIYFLQLKVLQQTLKTLETSLPLPGISWRGFGREKDGTPCKKKMA